MVKRILKCFLYVRWSGLVTSKSSKYTNTKSSPRVTWSIKRWKVWPEFLKPNLKVLVKLNKPKGVVTAVLCTSDGSTGIWWYARTKSIFEKTFDPAKRWVKSCIWEIGYRSGTVWAFKLLKSLHGLQSLIFVGTIWSVDDHSLSLGSITPNFIMSSNSRFAVTSLSGAERRGRANTGWPLITILCVIPCLTGSPFIVGRVSSGNWPDNFV